MGGSGALFDGVSGLDNHQAWMNVIGNNIANVNTSGFKGNQFNFQDVIYQTLKGASSAVTGGAGGTDFEQIGLGTNAGSIMTNEQQGSLQTTNLPTDFAIQGDGYFIVNNGSSNFYTRDSNFIVDAFGNVNQAATGFHLQGYGLKQIGNAVTIDNTKVVNLTVPQQINPAQQTNVLDLIGNLQSSTTTPQTQSVGVYDSLGQLHNVVLTFTPPTAAGGDWVVSATAADLSSGSSITVSGGNATASVAGSADLHFNSLGQLDGTVTPLILTFNGGNAPAQPATASSTTTAQEPWNIPSTTTTSNAAQTAVILNISDPLVGNLTSFASPTALQVQAAPSTLQIPNGNGPTITVNGNLTEAAPTAGQTAMGVFTFVAQDTSNSAAPHTYQIGMVTANGSTYTPTLLTVDGFSGAVPGTFNLQSGGGSALGPIVLQATDSTGQTHSFQVELSTDATGRTWGAYVDKVDGTNPLVTGSLSYGFGGTETTTLTVNKVEPDGINHRFDITLTGTDAAGTTTWTPTSVSVDGAPAPATVTLASAGAYQITDATGALAASNLTVTLNVAANAYGNVNAETQTFDLSPVTSTTSASSVEVDMSGPTAPLKFSGTGALLSGSNMTVGVAAKALYVGNLLASGLESNAAQTFNFNFGQVTNTAAATSASTNVGFATLPGGTTAFNNVVYTGGTATTPGTLTSGSPQTFTVAANAFDDGNGAQNITLDFSKITNSSNAMGLIGPLAGSAGNSAGSLKDFTVDQAGILHGVYTNGFTQTIGQILLATFENPAGLQREGQNLFQISADSGVVNVGTPGTGKFGTIAEGNIETSNVDLAQEFSNMILAERGFQANSRVITTADTMLSDLISLKQTP